MSNSTIKEIADKLFVKIKDDVMADTKDTDLGDWIATAIIRYDSAIQLLRDSPQSDKQARGLRMVKIESLTKADQSELKRVVRSQLKKVRDNRKEHDRKNKPPKPDAVKQSNSNAIERIKSNLLVQDLASGECFFWNAKRGKEKQISPKAVEEHWGKDKWKAYKENHGLLAIEDYDPYSGLSNWQDPDTKITHINSYIPPDWYADVYYGLAQPPQHNPDSKCPDLYWGFLLGLADGEAASASYLLDRLYIHLQRKIANYLVLMGEKGAGKGVYCAITSQLVGESNYFEGTTDDLTSRFNGHTEKLAVFMIDEFEVEDNDARKKVKSLVNDKGRFESKGKDARQGKRTANVICCSNPDESRLTKFDWGDRRYSIVRIAETPLTSRLPNNYIDVEAYVDDLLDPSNIAQLGTYLRYHHTTNTDFTKNFRSEAYAKELEDDQKPDWVIDLEAWAIRNPGSQEPYDNVRDSIWLHTTKKPGKKTATRKTKDNPYVKCYKNHDNVYMVKSLVDGTPEFGEATWSP